MQWPHTLMPESGFGDDFLAKDAVLSSSSPDATCLARLIAGTAPPACCQRGELEAMSSLPEIISQACQWSVIHRPSTNSLHSAFSSITGRPCFTYRSLLQRASSPQQLFLQHLLYSSFTCISVDEHPSRSTWVSYDQPPYWRHCPSLSLKTAPTPALPTHSTTLALFPARRLHRNTLPLGVRV